VELERQGVGQLGTAMMNTESLEPRHGEAGFSLVETIIAMGILATGLLSLAGVFVMGLSNLAGSSNNLIAREKAREAVESVHTARDTRVITWAQIKNVSNGGVFLDGQQNIRNTGADGLVNTADDAVEAIETLKGPGPDGILGNSDDTSMPLSDYKRQIVISELLTNGNPNPTLRQITVTVFYKVNQATRTYTLTTYISSIS
jgi:type II secretory pathway pseudopilin PulG